MDLEKAYETIVLHGMWHTFKIFFFSQCMGLPGKLNYFSFYYHTDTNIMLTSVESGVSLFISE